MRRDPFCAGRKNLLSHFRREPFELHRAVGKKIRAQFHGMELQINYLREMADDARVRAACVTYLQNWLPNFYPEHPELVEAAQKLAAKLDGKLHPPDLSWKYAWIQKTLGWNAAKNAQIRYNEIKAAARRSCDRALFRLGR